MPRSAATTVDEYLAELTDDRRTVMRTVLDVVRRHMPDGYAESLAYGMIGWAVPLSRYPKTYNGHPLGYVSLAAQKTHYALYLVSAYQDPKEEAWLVRAFEAAGKPLDMGKSCVRFKRLEDLPLDAIGTFVSRTPVDRFIAQHEAVRKAAKNR